jgi:anti-sigma factor RsiW
MKPATPGFEELNAYVDGELSPASAAAVARAVAEDPAVARQVAQLTRLKAMLQSERAAPAIALPSRRPRRAPRRPRRIRPTSLAASLALFVALAVSVTFWLEGRAPSPEAPLVFASAQHRAWVEGGVEAQPAAHVLPSALRTFGRPAQVPDLSAAGLMLARVALLQDESGPVLHIGYRGTRGCRLSLMIRGPDGLPEALRAVGESADLGYAWRAGGVGYVLVASGMDPPRLRLIARKVHDATLEKAPFDAETRTALAESRAASAACTG